MIYKRVAAAEPPGSLLQMQNLRSYARLTNSLAFEQAAEVMVHTLKFGKQWQNPNGVIGA